MKKKYRFMAFMALTHNFIINIILITLIHLIKFYIIINY